jgi:hypothetical protein
MMDDADWQPLYNEDRPDGLPYATHFGILNIGGNELRVFQLNTGKRVILEEDMAAFFGCTKDEFRDSTETVRPYMDKEIVPDEFFIPS